MSTRSSPVVWGHDGSRQVLFSLLSPLHVGAGIYRPPGACATLKTAGATLLFNHPGGEGPPGPVCQRPFPLPDGNAAAHTHNATKPCQKEWQAASALPWNQRG